MKPARGGANAARRVLFLNMNWIVGGQEVVMLDLIRHLDRARYQPLVACFAEGMLAETLRREGVPTHVLPPHRVRQPLRLARAILELSRLIARERIDVVHCNGDTLLLYGALAAGPLGVPCVWHVYEPVATHGNAFVRFFYLTQRLLRADCTIFGTAAVEPSYVEKYPRLGARTPIMPGVDVDGLLAGADAPAARRRLGIPGDVPLLLSIARLQRSKGQRELLEAVAGLHGDFTPPHVVLCGGPPVMVDEDFPDELRALTVELGLAGRVHATGHVSDAEKRDLLAAANVLVHPAQREAFGIAVIEGMAAGKPVIVSDSVGPSSIVEGSGAGLIVPRRDVAALRDAIRRVLEDPAAAARMGELGRMRARERYATERMVEKVEQVYDAVIARRRGGA